MANSCRAKNLILDMLSFFYWLLAAKILLFD
nr:MAG TPA: hypothetical protein [Caudoviricetes sp.]